MDCSISNIARGTGEWLFPRSRTGLYTKVSLNFLKNSLTVSCVSMKDVKGSAVTLKHKQLFIGHYGRISFGGTIYAVSLSFRAEGQVWPKRMSIIRVVRRTEYNCSGKDSKNYLCLFKCCFLCSNLEG